MLPLVDASNNLVTVLQVIMQQALRAGIERVGIVCSPWQQDMLRQYFAAVEDQGSEIFSSVIQYIVQPEPKGFGDAVLRGADFVADEPFVLLLGDHVHIQDSGVPNCTMQVAEDFMAQDGVAMIGVQAVDAQELSRVGVCRGAPMGKSVYRCVRFVEKPCLSVARDCLVTEGLPAETFLAHCGIYVFSSEIFDCLRHVKSQKLAQEIELADAQRMLLERCPEKYFLCRIEGCAYDVGTPAGYAEAQHVFRSVAASHATGSRRSIGCTNTDTT
jgi:UTP--glucose-1-phosphate uridylyltransferase